MAILPETSEQIRWHSAIFSIYNLSVNEVFHLFLIYTCLKLFIKLTTQDDIKDPINDRLTLAERNERLHNQLKSLKEDLAHTRDETGETTMDRIHKENVRQGRDKYKTLREVRKGNTKRRVDQFENMWITRRKQRNFKRWEKNPLKKNYIFVSKSAHTVKLKECSHISPSSLCKREQKISHKRKTLKIYSSKRSIIPREMKKSKCVEKVKKRKKCLRVYLFLN